MLNLLVNALAAILLLNTILQSGTAGAEQVRASGTQAVLLKSVEADQGVSESTTWFKLASEERHNSVKPPTKLAIIACRIESPSQDESAVAGEWRDPEWRVPVECMRVLETVSDAAALSNLWLRQMAPNLADYDTCAEVAMAYAPIWESNHKSWAIVKVGCPTKMVDADGNIVGWHMPECQGTLPGTTYPLRCRFDPSEI